MIQLHTDTQPTQTIQMKAKPYESRLSQALKKWPAVIRPQSLVPQIHSQANITEEENSTSILSTIDLAGFFTQLKPVTYHVQSASQNVLEECVDLTAVAPSEGGRVFLQFIVPADKKLALKIKFSAKQSWMAAKIHFELAKNAEVDYALITEDLTFAHLEVSSHLQENARLQETLILKQTNQGFLHTMHKLLAPQAHVSTQSLVMGQGKEQWILETSLLHQSAHTTSDQLAKNLLADESKSSFQGKITIFKEAQEVNASQLQRSLLLSEKAQALAEPQLAIYADQVKCAHGSTTGQLSDEEIFYLEARGIPKNRASELLKQAFIQEVYHHPLHLQLKKLISTETPLLFSNLTPKNTL